VKEAPRAAGWAGVWLLHVRRIRPDPDPRRGQPGLPPALGDLLSLPASYNLAPTQRAAVVLDRGEGPAGAATGLGPAPVLVAGKGAAGLDHQRPHRNRGHEGGVPQRVQGAAMPHPDGRVLRVVGQPGRQEEGPVVHPCRYAPVGRWAMGGR